MSRIGNKPITIPEKVEVLIKDMTISVKDQKENWQQLLLMRE